MWLKRNVGGNACGEENLRQMGERRANRLNVGAEMEARESYMKCVPRTVAVDRSSSEKKKLKKIKKDHYSLMISS